MKKRAEQPNVFRSLSDRRLRVAVMITACVAAGSFSSAGESRATAEPVPYRFYGFFNIGTYDAEEDLGLLGSASYEFQLAGGFGHRLNRYFSGELELGVMGREHELPSSLTPDLEDPTLSILWLSYSLVARVPVGKFEPFVGLGVGSGQAYLGESDDYPDGPNTDIDEDSGILFFYRIGFDAAVGKRSRLGLELRRMKFEADLGAFTDGETDIGGTGALFTYRRMF